MTTDNELLRFEQERGTMPPDEYLGHEYDQDEDGRVIIPPEGDSMKRMTRRGIIWTIILSSIAAVLIGIGSSMWLVTW